METQSAEMTSASINSSEDIAAFLSRALAGGALAVGELEAEARAAGLLRENAYTSGGSGDAKTDRSGGPRIDFISYRCCWAFDFIAEQPI
jgi:hypothetical protein